MFHRAVIAVNVLLCPVSEALGQLFSSYCVNKVDSKEKNRINLKLKRSLETQFS